jgi:hypothetical protein
MITAKERQVIVSRGDQVAVEIDGQDFIGTIIIPRRTFGEEIADGITIMIHDLDNYEMISSTIKHEYQNGTRNHGEYTAPIEKFKLVEKARNSNRKEAKSGPQVTRVLG